MYIENGKIAGRVKEFEKKSDNIILDKMTKDGSRNAFVRPENEGIVWKVCNDRLPEYALSKGFVPVVMFDLYGQNCNIYPQTDRHIPELVDQVARDVKQQYTFEYIPDYMVNHYRIHEYNGCESVVLLVDKYKLDAIANITKNGQATESQIDAINHILTKNIQMLSFYWGILNTFYFFIFIIFLYYFLKNEKK